MNTIESKCLYVKKLGPLLKKYISMCIFLFVTLLFSIKYISRYSDFYVLGSLLVGLIVVSIFLFHRRLFRIEFKYLEYFQYIIIFFYLILSFFIFIKIPVETLNVDRWSVITSFWENFEKNEYVYFAKSNVGNPPGPMPFYFILAYPFYLLGELGLYSMLGLPLFIVLLKYCKIKSYLIITVLILLAFSPFVWWEILCRSNIFLNAVLVLFSITYFLNNHKLNTKRLIISGILFGLLLSTRSIFSIAYVIVCIYALKSHYIGFKKFILLGGIAILSFIVTFLPFIFNHGSEFVSMNPFIIQSTFLMPLGCTVFFIFLSFVFGYFCYNLFDVYFYISLNLFLCILIYFIYEGNIIGLHEAVFGWVVDISYFIFSVPFVLFYIFSVQNKSIQYDLGKENSSNSISL